MNDPPTGMLFEEHQRFRQPWVWILILPLSGGVIGLFAYALYQQLYVGEPWGRNPIPDAALIVIAALMFVLGFGLPLFMYTMRLSVRVDATHLDIHFAPFFRERHAIARIANCEVRTYRPIRDFGGWGVRWSLREKGGAYNVRGNRGVQLEFAGGRRLLIGSGRPEELVRAIECARGV